MDKIDADHTGLLVKLLAKGVITVQLKRHLEVNYITVLNSGSNQICTSCLRHLLRMLNCALLSKTLERILVEPL